MAKHLFSIKFINFVTDLQKYGSVAQLNRASDSGSAGHGFESHPSHFVRSHWGSFFLFLSSFFHSNLMKTSFESEKKPQISSK